VEVLKRLWFHWAKKIYYVFVAQGRPRLFLGAGTVGGLLSNRFEGAATDNSLVGVMIAAPVGVE
jgi:hypothetical protein